jgi:hypothetical protein
MRDAYRLLSQVLRQRLAALPALPAGAAAAPAPALGGAAAGVLPGAVCFARRPVDLRVTSRVCLEAAGRIGSVPWDLRVDTQKYACWCGCLVSCSHHHLCWRGGSGEAGIWCNLEPGPRLKCWRRAQARRAGGTRC